VEILLAAGADTDRECFDTPLWLAANNGSVGAMKSLIRAGADVHRRTEGGSTLLMTAARAGKPEAIRILLAEGIPIDAVHPTHGHTALMMAASEDVRTTRALLRAGANVNVRDVEGGTAITHAMDGAMRAGLGDLSAEKWNPQIIQMLLDAGADPTVRDAEGRDLMALAARTRHYRAEIEKILAAH
jgi:ankyrin repeat protein